jgi:hemerythrin-like metal-binding protein
LDDPQILPKSLSFMIFEQGVTPGVPGQPVKVFDQEPTVPRGVGNRRSRDWNWSESSILRDRIGNYPAQLSELLRTMNASPRHSPVDVEGPIKRLEAFIEARFLEEEEFMRCSAYPGLEGHVAIHNIFRDELRMLYLMAANRYDNAARLATTTIEQWVQDHGATQDREFMAFLASQGAEVTAR